MIRAHLVAAAAGWLSLPPVLWRLCRGVRNTSLEGAWIWMIIAWAAWGAAILASTSESLPAGCIDLAWYGVAVAMLVPPIAVLGARRPIHRVWTGFVLLPLLLVFAWPALSAFGAGNRPAAWNLEEPMLVGFSLVAVMGAGNYVGLRFTVPAILWLTALALVVGPLCPTTARWLPQPESARGLAAGFLAASGWSATWLATRRTVSIDTTRKFSLERVWLDFRDLFGVVWARRVQERFNDEMHRGNLKVRMGIDGLEGIEEADLRSASTADLQAADSFLRWLLQKFVDPAWIEARMGEKEGTGTGDRGTGREDQGPEAV